MDRYDKDKDRQSDCGLDGVEIAGQVPAGLPLTSLKYDRNASNRFK